MSQVSEIIAKVKSKELSPDEAGNQLRLLILGSASPQPEPGTPEFKDFRNQRLADKDDEGYDDSFQEITAAWIGGDLSDGQYHTIREVVMEGLSAPEPEEDEEEDDDVE